MAKTQQQYTDELWSAAQQKADQFYEQRKQNDSETIQQNNQAIDQVAQAQTDPYKTQMEQLPQQAQELYDLNAVQELVGRRQVQESMNNLGLADSGLSRAQQTGLTLRKNNADADVRLAQQQKTQELQDKIDQILKNADVQKLQQETAVRSDSANWYDTLMANAYSNAQQLGASLYQAEQDRISQAEELRKQREADAALLERQLQASQMNPDRVLKMNDAIINPDSFGKSSYMMQRYGSYQEYVRQTITQWMSSGSLTAREAQFLANMKGVTL